MAIKSRNKISATFSMSGMTDIVFLLLVFFMITSTMIHPNALKLLLPKSNNQVSAKPITTISIDKNINYYVEREKVEFSQIEGLLFVKFADVPEIDRWISVHVDKSVPFGEVVKVMNIAKNNKYRVIAATSAE
ncbi:ExbD/TolR family protein [Bacteroidota bacterium]